MSFKTPDLCDQFEAELGKTVRVVAPMFQPYGGRAAFCGEIVTLKIFEDNTLVREIFGEDGKGKVLVIDGGGSLRCALVGDQLTILAHKNGWEGVVVYGCIRDSGDIAAIDIGVRALNTHPQKTVKKGIGERNLAVTFGGVTFNPGEFLYADEDGIMVVVLDPEGRRSHDDFVVSGTRFPVAGAGSMAGVAPKSTDDWLRDYADPVLAAVQKTLDGLYGPEAFTAEMDAGGFVVVATQIPALKQETKEPGSWFAAEMRRMAGVDGSVRGNDKRISEVKAVKQSKMPPPKKVGPFSTARTPERDKLAKKLAKNPGVRDPQRLAFWIGLRAAGSKTEEMSSVSNRMRDLLST